jgi:hypothetical protein
MPDCEFAADCGAFHAIANAGTLKHVGGQFGFGFRGVRRASVIVHAPRYCAAQDIDHLE